jgi:hypothetical protein
MRDTLEYQYKFTATRLTLGVLVMSGAAVGIGYLANTNDAGLSFKHIVALSPATTTMVFWLFAGICGSLAVLVLASLLSGTTKRTYHIKLTPTEFSAPKWSLFTQQNLTVPYSQITSMFIQRAGHIRFLHIRTVLGKVIINELDIGQSAFEELLAALAERVPRNG